LKRPELEGFERDGVNPGVRAIGLVEGRLKECRRSLLGKIGVPTPVERGESAVALASWREDR